MAAGKVYLIGAGPGSADLITVRGCRALRQAQVVVCDRLVSESFLQDLGIGVDGKTIISIGDEEGHKTQAEINNLMADSAQAGKVVARLKSGDPLVFGRGMEELEFLSGRGILWEVIPGPSAATAGPAAAAMALTRRETGRSFAVVTARCAGGAVNESFPRADSLVVFMAVGVLDEVVACLLKDGWPASTPVAILERAWQKWQRRVFSPLCEIVERSDKADIMPPAILLIGEAAIRPDAFEDRPTILFTGLDAANFLSLGDVLHWPALQIVRNEEGYEAVPDVLTGLEQRAFDHVIFTSRVGVKSFVAALEAHGRDVRVMAETTITAAGAGTAMLLSEHGLRADIVPKEPGSSGILHGMGDLSGSSVLLVQGSHAPRDLRQKIEQKTGSVTRLSLHRVEANPCLGRSLPDHDVIYLVSPSGVKAWWNAYGPDGFKQRVWCIGEVTRAELNRLGIEAEVVRPYVS